MEADREGLCPILFLKVHHNMPVQLKRCGYGAESEQDGCGSHCDEDYYKGDCNGCVSYMTPSCGHAGILQSCWSIIKALRFHALTDG